MNQNIERSRPKLPLELKEGNQADARIAQMLRVDHAGEMAAVEIYRAQRKVFARARTNSDIEAQLAHQEQDEIKHKAEFDALLVKHNVRPTLMEPIWKPAAQILGYATALMGEKAAHACTVAVEEVIEEHYRAQEEELGDTNPELKATIVKFREEETAHKNDALQSGAEETFGYPILSAFIKAGCRAAIAISQKV